jgi:apolipoprotein N-acyltransferase
VKARLVKIGRALRPAKSHALAGLLGLASVAAYAPFEFSPLILATLAGLFWLWGRAETGADAFKLGTWFGLGLFGGGVSWLFSSMYFYSGVVLPAAAAATFGFVLFLALYLGLAGWLAHNFKDPKRPFLTLVVVFPAVWVLAEYLRGTLFGGFPFLQLGVTHLDTWLQGYAPLLGVLGVSWAVALSAALLLWLIQKRAWLAPSLLLCVLWVSGGALQKVQWVTPVGEPIEVALVQGNIAQERKWQQDNLYPTLQSYVELTRQNLDADVVVWPETAIPTYFDIAQRGALYSFIKDAQLLKRDIVAGVIDRNRETGEYYNAMVNLGQPEARYYKHHLVPFSEFFPFPSVFTFLSNLFEIPFSSFSAGTDTPQPMLLGGQPAGLSVCYEMMFGEEQAAYLPEATYLLTVSNDAWFARTFEPAQQVQEVRMRSLELGREIARSTNTGYTLVTTVDGQIKASIAPYEEGVLRAQVQPYEGMTFYAQWQRLPVLFLLFTVLGFILSKRYFLRGRLT